MTFAILNSNIFSYNLNSNTITKPLIDQTSIFESKIFPNNNLLQNIFPFLFTYSNDP